MGRDSFQKLKTIATWHAKTFRASLLCWASLCVALDSLIATCCNMQFFAMLCDWRAHLLQFSFANRHLICWESASMEDCVKQRGKKTIMQTPKENGLFAKNALPNVSNMSHWWCILNVRVETNHAWNAWELRSKTVKLGISSTECDCVKPLV